MAISTGETVSILNHLIQTCKDGEEGYRNSSEAVERSDLKGLFLDLAAQRQKFASELQSLVVSIGGDAATSGSPLGWMHRGWINIKSAISSRNEHEIIEECERGEDAAVDTYRNALAEDIPTECRRVVQHQLTEVQAAHDKVRSLEVATENVETS